MAPTRIVGLPAAMTKLCLLGAFCITVVASASPRRQGLRWPSQKVPLSPPAFLAPVTRHAVGSSMPTRWSRATKPSPAAFGPVRGPLPSQSPSSPLRKGSTVRQVAPSLIRDIGGAAIVAAATTIWLKLWTTLASKGRVDSKVSRKVIHCGSGPLFMLCWPFFSGHPSARFIAASVPLLQVFALLISGLSKRQNAEGKAEGLVAAISRSGKPQEVLRGPFIYVIVLLLATVLYWRNNVVGLIAVSQMAAGDGMADIVGRRFGSLKWPFSKDKSYAGTLAFVMAGFLATIGLMSWFHYWGLIALTPSEALLKVAAISVFCAFVELSPPSPLSAPAWKIPLGDDNISVPLAASLLAILLFPASSVSPVPMP